MNAMTHCTLDAALADALEAALARDKRALEEERRAKKDAYAALESEAEKILHMSYEAVVDYERTSGPAEHHASGLYPRPPKLTRSTNAL